MSNKKLYIGNLSYVVQGEDLRKLFQSYGEINDIQVIEGKGYGFVEFALVDQARAAKKALDGAIFKSRVLRIDFSQEQA